MLNYKHIVINSLLVLLLAIGLIPQNLKATHIVGGDMTYRCLGNDLYEITLTIRRDCENGDGDSPFDDPAIIGVFDIFGSLQIHLGTLGRYEIPFMDEDTITNSQVFDCSVLGTPVCVHESVYRDTFFLPFNEIGYRLAYQRCCRNSILVNIEEPLETGATYHVALPVDVLTQCNGQPEFNNWPDVYVCVNEPLSFDHSATDPDGDQLVYKLCTPSKGATRENPRPFTPSHPPYPTVVWTGPYGLSNMIGGNPPMSINAATGELTAMPDQVGTYLVGICVEEYRNGELLSTVRRDFEYNVRVCVEPVVIDFSVDGIDCDGDLTAGFFNNSTGADSYRWIITNNSGDTIHITSDNSFEFDFPEFGSYDVTLEGTRISDGCTARATENVVIGNPDVVADFVIGIESCDSANLLRITDASFDPVGSSVPVQWTWSVNGQDAGSGSSIVFDVEGLNEIDIELAVRFNSQCFADTIRSFVISDLFPDVAFGYKLVECLDDGLLFEFSSSYSSHNLNVRELNWTIVDNGLTQTYTDDTLLLGISAFDTEVSLDISFDNDCRDSYTEIINASDLLPVLGIISSTGNDMDCPEEGESLDVHFSAQLTGGAFGGNIESYKWSVNSVSGTDVNDPRITRAIMEGDSLRVNLFVVLENGCELETELLYLAQFAPEPEIEISSECSGDSIIIILTESGDFEIESYIWFVDQEEESSDSTIRLLLGDSGNLIKLELIYANGCEQEYSMFFDASQFRPEIEPFVDILSCEDDTANINLLIDPGIALVGEEILINGIEYDSFPVDLWLALDDLLSISYFVEYENGCNDFYEDERVLRDYLPKPDYKVDLIECFEDGIAISLMDITDSEIDYATEFIITDGDTVYTLADPVDSLYITSPVIEIIQNVSFENACMISDTSDLIQEDILPEINTPELNFDIVPVECFGDSGIFTFIDLTEVPECLYIVEHLWVINGDSCIGNPVSKMIPLGEDIPFVLSLTFNNGLVLSTETDTIDNDGINSNDYVDELPIEIGNNNSGFCNDSLDLYILNPDSSVNYEWAVDIDFENIIGTGVSIDTFGGVFFNGIVYVQTIENYGDCVYGLDSLEIQLDTLSLSYDDPFEICAGDTAFFTVTNNNPDQIIDYLWKGGNGQLISAENTDSPVIGIPEGTTEDFFLILCTENESGCSAVDTIHFEIGTADTLSPFSYSIDSCGSLTVMFDESPNNLGDDAYWDFGDGNTGQGSMVEHDYATAGTYLVTLSDSSDICPADPISMEILVDVLSIDVFADTIYYDPDSLVTLEAETNGNDDDNVSWCLEDGTRIGTGNPLDGFDVMGDTLLVLVKIEDEFGCSDRDTLVLIPERDPEDCLDSLMISGPDREAVCVGEELQLCVVLDDECDPEDFSYLWSPEDCIVDGQGTPKVTIIATESKTVMVLVTDTDSGLDSVYSYNIEVSNPDPQISIPDMNIDSSGLPFVCLGQEITISIDPLDPNCDYNWSNGMSGSPIILSPEEDITLFVECEDEFGCVGISDTITIRVVPPRCDESDVFIPNAFSPNGDNVNDILYVRSKFIRDMELVIVDRWGKEVFRTTDISIGWDGTYNDEPLPMGAYSYALSGSCVDGQTFIRKGNVSLLR